MGSWLALIVAPSTALAVQGIMYALVTPSCSQQVRIWIHLAAALALLVAAVLAGLAWRDGVTHSPTLPHGPDSDHGDPHSSRRFLAMVASGVAAISCVVIVLMWTAAWMLSPCSEH